MYNLHSLHSHTVFIKCLNNGFTKSFTAEFQIHDFLWDKKKSIHDLVLVLLVVCEKCDVHRITSH